jgi:hypothetical protein
VRGLLIAVALLASNVATAAANDDAPAYVALNYNVPGRHPPLTRAQVARIRQVLAQVKPCQRPLVRYLLSSEWPDLVKDGIAFMFKAQPNNESAHVFGAPNLYYMPSMGLFPGPPDEPARGAQEKEGIQWDIDFQPCPH